jgi:pilus assembly protein Flp/PilA
MTTVNKFVRTGYEHIPHCVNSQSSLNTSLCFSNTQVLLCVLFNHQEIYMKKLVQASKKFWRDESGVTAIEYGLIAALIAVGIVSAVTLIGTDLKAAFEAIETKLPATY